MLIAFAYVVDRAGDLGHAGWLHGLKIVAIAVVQAVPDMAKVLCLDRDRATLAVAGAIVALTLPTTLDQVGAIAVGAVIGWRFLPAGPPRTVGRLGLTLGRGVAFGSPATFLLLLFMLPAALHTPVWTGGITSPVDFAIGVSAFLLMVFWRVAAWLVVVLEAIAASAIAA